ncbi:GNAT family N-acetyltransferase [Ureibacillus chungkukjangi]|uniref:GNAT acetyltransferase-like protein n=1 Tax=Ureibacillus chungkukjangi TaxID=1202712 RepID=A0A318U4I9_9BACL|nr:GNAT family N-acetyltransferase [Ureibacillus chungkukjangi]MCM3387147.1 GNAT family N-acetyltransferase [Ureibacillus chungkukjangi]PYF06829.1 GNAT acetyltransferase-like protein [Ureibacillus chungkukjangi]
MLTDDIVMDIHAKVLFQHDIENRITRINEPPFDLAPKVFIGATRLRNIVRFSSLLDENIVERLEKVFEENAGTDLAEVIKILNEVGQVNDFWMGPAFVFPDIKESNSSNIIQVKHENKALLKPYFPYTFEDFEYKKPCFVVMKDNKPISICCSARQTEEAAEASVFTNENYRGKGYGIEVTNAWAAEVQRQGRVALYSTSWDNFASQALARKLDLIQFGTDIHMG